MIFRYFGLSCESCCLIFPRIEFLSNGGNVFVDDVYLKWAKARRKSRMPVWLACAAPRARQKTHSVDVMLCNALEPFHSFIIVYLYFEIMSRILFAYTTHGPMLFCLSAACCDIPPFSTIIMRNLNSRSRFRSRWSNILFISVAASVAFIANCWLKTKIFGGWTEGRSDEGVDFHKNQSSK